MKKINHTALVLHQSFTQLSHLSQPVSSVLGNAQGQNCRGQTGLGYNWNEHGNQDVSLSGGRALLEKQGTTRPRPPVDVNQHRSIEIRGALLICTLMGPSPQAAAYREIVPDTLVSLGYLCTAPLGQSCINAVPWQIPHTALHPCALLARTGWLTAGRDS